jgi:hypothetical protein
MKLEMCASRSVLFTTALAALLFMIACELDAVLRDV